MLWEFHIISTFSSISTMINVLEVWEVKEIVDFNLINISWSIEFKVLFRPPLRDLRKAKEKQTKLKFDWIEWNKRNFNRISFHFKHFYSSFTLKSRFLLSSSSSQHSSTWWHAKTPFKQFKHCFLKNSFSWNPH